MHFFETNILEKTNPKALSQKEISTESGSVKLLSEKRVSPRKFFELLHAQLSFDDPRFMAYATTSMAFVIKNGESVDVAFISDADPVVDMARKMIKSKRPASVYYARVIVKLLPPLWIPHLLFGGTGYAPYLCGVGPSGSIYNEPLLIEECMTRGLDYSAVGVVRRSQVELLARVFMGVHGGFSKISDLDQHYPEGLLDVLLQLTEASPDARHGLLVSYFRDFFKKDLTMDVRSIFEVLTNVYVKNMSSSKQDIRTAALKLFKKAGLSVWCPSKTELLVGVWSDLDFPVTNVVMNTAEPEYDYLNLTREVDLGNIVRRIYDACVQNGSFLLKPSSLSNNIRHGGRVLTTVETSVVIAKELLNADIRVYFYMNVGGVSTLGVPGVYVTDMTIVDYSTMSGIYTIDIGATGNLPLYGPIFVNTVHKLALDYQREVVELLVGGEQEAQDLYDDLSNKYGSWTVNVTCVSLKKIRVESDEEKVFDIEDTTFIGTTRFLRSNSESSEDEIFDVGVQPVLHSATHLIDSGDVEVEETHYSASSDESEVNPWI